MEPQFAALIAIDWADQKHVWAMEIPGQTKSQTGSLPHTPEAIDVWAVELATRFGGQQIAVALEQSTGPLVFMLTKYPHLIIYPVYCSSLANYRKSFRPSGAKDDPIDAQLILDIATICGHFGQRPSKLAPSSSLWRSGASWWIRKPRAPIA
jgi:hypothetical protein